MSKKIFSKNKFGINFRKNILKLELDNKDGIQLSTICRWLKLIAEDEIRNFLKGWGQIATLLEIPTGRK